VVLRFCLVLSLIVFSALCVFRAAMKHQLKTSLRRVDRWHELYSALARIFARRARLVREPARRDARGGTMSHAARIASSRIDATAGTTDSDRSVPRKTLRLSVAIGFEPVAAAGAARPAPGAGPAARAGLRNAARARSDPKMAPAWRMETALVHESHLGKHHRRQRRQVIRSASRTPTAEALPSSSAMAAGASFGSAWWETASNAAAILTALVKNAALATFVRPSATPVSG
jgi:hypothetical protein